jgi:hypothetical protein
MIAEFRMYIVPVFAMPPPLPTFALSLIVLLVMTAVPGFKTPPPYRFSDIKQFSTIMVDELPLVMIPKELFEIVEPVTSIASPSRPPSEFLSKELSVTIIVSPIMP